MLHSSRLPPQRTSACRHAGSGCKRAFHVRQWGAWCCCCCAIQTVGCCGGLAMPGEYMHMGAPFTGTSAVPSRVQVWLCRPLCEQVAFYVEVILMWRSIAQGLVSLPSLIWKREEEIECLVLLPPSQKLNCSAVAGMVRRCCGRCLVTRCCSPTPTSTGTPSDTTRWDTYNI